MVDSDSCVRSVNFVVEVITGESKSSVLEQYSLPTNYFDSEESAADSDSGKY